MKKHYFLVLILSLSLVSSKAAIDTIEVTSNQFTPFNIPNVVVGDTVRFHFTQGFHNAISTGIVNGIPAGAAEINSGNPAANIRTYDYVVTVAGDYKYICEVHGTAQPFSDMRGTFTATESSLPATIKSFNLATIKNKPFFTWVTLMEENVSHFSIRSSFDAVQYQEVGRVSASVNAAGEHSYSFTDNEVPNKYKYIYYMLAVVDKDGKEKLSQVKVFRNPISAPKLITEIGPNPIKRPGQLMIRFNADKEGKILARVFDIDGKLVLETSMSAFPGLNSGHVHICDLNAGTYNIQFILDGIKETKKVVVY